MALEKEDHYFDCSENAIKFGWLGTNIKTQNYIVKFREHGKDSMFKQTQAKENEVILSHLKGGTLYEIRVYLEKDDGDELLYFSTTASTVAPILSPFIGICDKISDKPTIYRFRPSNIRNLGIDVRVWEMDSEEGIKHADIEKTIIFVGARTAGKSTLIDAMINYVAGVLYVDGYRFKIVDDGRNSPSKSSDVGGTKSITCYKVPHLNGFNVGYDLTIIDTPGFEEETESICNLNIMLQLTTLLESGVVHFFDAVCLVLPSSCRLTEGQRNIFGNIMSLVGRDMNSFIPVVTFDDGGQIHALSALKKAEVPYMQNMYYRFNNSGLFSGLESEESWSKRCDSWRVFFETLQIVAKQSVELTLKVLKLKGVLNKEIELLKKKKEVMDAKAKNIFDNRAFEKDQERLQRQNENYRYEADEFDYLREVHCNQLCINCPKCKETCNRNCSFCTSVCWWFILFLCWCWSFCFIQKCIYILCCCCVLLNIPTKNLLVCKCKCLIGEHKKENKMLVKIYRKVQKENTEMKAKYECATATKRIVQTRVCDIEKELNSLMTQYELQVQDLKETFEQLRKIALQPANDSELKKLEEYVLQSRV